MRVFRQLTRAALGAAVALSALTAVALPVRAQDPVELRVVWYNDGNEGEVLRTLLDRFESENSDIKVVVDTLPYADYHTVLQTQIESGSPPDLARVNDVARFAGQYLDLREVASAEFQAYLTKNYAPAVLDSLRTAEDNEGLYGFPLQFSVTVPYINKTLFEQAEVAIPGETATWADWVDAAKEVATKTETPYAIAIDRTGHRFWGFSLVQGATYINDDGSFTIDTPGFRKAAQELIDWHTQGIIPKDVWAASGGGYVAAAEYFINGQTVVYYSGTWQIANFDKNITQANKFEWQLVPNPTGEADSTGIPGGSLFAAFKAGKNPEQSAKLIEFLTQADVVKEFSEKTLFIPGHLGVIESGVTYATNQAALDVALKEIPKITEEAYQLQYSAFTFVLNPEIRDRLSQVIVGEITLDEAIVLIQKKIDEAVAAAK